jgi:ABC-type lipoprotein release transport system permease subunit
MKLKIKYKPEILTTVLSILGIVLIVLSAFFFTRLDLIVHGDLYDFGLQFNNEWAQRYWTYSRLIMVSIAIAISAVVLSISTILVQVRTRRSYLKLTGALLIIAILMIGFSVFLFTRLDFVVHNDLYRYGLQFSYEWAERYWTYSKLMQSTLGVTTAISAAVVVYVFFTMKKSPPPTFQPRKIHSARPVWWSLASISFRNIPRRKLRNSLTVLAIILGVTLMVGVNIAFDNVYAQFKHTINQAAGNVDITIRSSLDLPFNQSILATVKETDGVADVYTRTSSSVNCSRNQDWVTASMIGVNSTSDFEYVDLDSTNITNTRDLRMNSTDAVVDARLNFTVGETITLKVTVYSGLTSESTDYNFTVVGIYHPNPIVLEYSGQFGGNSDYTIYVDIEKARNLLDYGSKVDSISVRLTDIKKSDQVVNELNSKLGTDYVITPVKKTILGIIENATSGLRSGLQIMSVMALCVAIVIVLNTMYMNVGERTYEIGILRSQGASTPQVFWIFFSESLILGIIGVLIGLFTGMMATDVFRYFTSRIFQPFSPGFSTQFSLFSADPQHLILGAATGMLTVIIGGLFPSIKASKADIINALRPSMRKSGKPRTALKLIAIGLPLTIIGAFIFMGFDYFQQFGLGLFVASAFAPIPMIGVTMLAAGLLRSASPVIEHVLTPFGKTRKIISRNIERNLLRSTICFALIGMSLNLVIVMGGAQTGTVMGVENVIRSFSSSDLTVTSKTLISNSFADNLTAVDAMINITTPVLIVPQRTILQSNMSTQMINSSSTIMAIDPTSYHKAMSMTFSEDTPSDVFAKLNTSGTIILTSPLAKSLEVTVNDKVEMRIISIILVPVTIPDPNYTIPSPPTYNSTIPDPTYNGTIPPTPTYNTTIPTITIYVPETKITRENFTVIGIAQGAWLEIMSVGSFSLSEACYISYNSLNSTYPKYNNMSNLFFLKANPSGDVDLIKDQIKEKYGNDYELGVTTYNDAVNRVRSSIDQIFYILYSVVMFAVFNAAIGVAAIMIMNVAERRREIGIFRSQGMSKFQVVVSIIGEATFLGIVGFFSGTVVGLIFHRITVSYMHAAGFPMAFIIPYDAIGLTLVLAVITSVMSALYPSNRASKLNIVEALRH